MTQLRDLNPEDGIALYTDGSANSHDKSGGWAWVAVDAHGKVAMASGYRSGTTNNQMELHAVAEGLRAIGYALGSVDVLVYSDSQYVVLGSRDRSRGRYKNLDFWRNVDAAADDHSYIEWLHVKGHSTSFYNGLADKLAGQARREGVTVRAKAAKRNGREYRQPSQNGSRQKTHSRKP